MKYRSLKKYKYQIMSDEKFILPTNLGFKVSTDWINLNGDVLNIKKGYCYNGPNFPAIDTLNFRIPSLVHDALCQLIRIGELPSNMWDAAGEIMYYFCLRCGMSRFRAWYCRWAVNTLGDKRLELGVPQDQIYEINLPIGD